MALEGHFLGTSLQFFFMKNSAYSSIKGEVLEVVEKPCLKESF